MTLLHEDAEHCADILDIAANVTTANAAAVIATASMYAAPEQEQNEDGSWPVTECVDCDNELGARAALAKVRCIHCQRLLEKKRDGYGMG